MVNAELGPSQDLAKRLAALEGRVAALSTNAFAAELALPVTAAAQIVTITSNTITQAWEAIFPLRHPFMAYTIWVGVAAGTIATIEIDVGPNSFQGILVANTVTFTVDGTTGAFSAPFYGGMKNAIGPSNSAPAVNLGGDPSQYGTAWGVVVSASVNTGSVTVQAPMLFGRFTQ